MALPKNVQDAVDSLECEIADPDDCTAWQTIRAHLLSQDAEIDRLESAWHVETLNGKDRLIALQEAENDRVKSRLAAADALLREISITAGQGLDMSFQLRQVQAHLQGSGDE